MLSPYVDITLMELHTARGPLQGDLWDQAGHIGPDTGPEDEDQSGQW
jgi:hypothetical protein